MAARDPDARPAAPPLDQLTRERVEEVVKRLGRAADANGFVPFDRFMEVALYADEVGFYAAPSPPLGTAGSFYTAAHVTPLFGATLARHLLWLRDVLFAGAPFGVVELGPGDGTLAATVLDALGGAAARHAPFEYRLIERSPAQRARAVARAGPVAARVGARLTEGSSLGDGGPFEGVVVANELLDSLPARRVRWSGTAWRELGVRLAEGRPVPAEADLVAPVPDGPPTDELAPGTVVEFAPALDAVVREVGDHLVRGTFLVLDYGMEGQELRRAHPSGTLEAVRSHRRLADPVAEPGSADLSVFVDFTRVRGSAARAGLEVLRDSSQAEALGDWGFPNVLETAVRAASSSEAEVRVRLAAKNLLFGFERFRALEFAPPSSAAVLRALRSRA